MDGFVLPPKLLTELSKAADTVRGHGFFQIFSHYDPDGISSAAIIAKALFRAGKEFRVTIFPTLDDRYMEVVKACDAECIIISDLGASYIKELDAMSMDIIVLDHHTVGDRAQRICYANPHLYGIDGATSGCGATMCQLFAVTLDEKNWDLVQVALAGITGDRQTARGMLGLNTYILEQGVARGYLKVMDGSLVPFGELTAMLFSNTDPYVRGVSGNADGVAKILDDAGVDRSKYYTDLTEEELRRLSSLIGIKLAEQGVEKSYLNEVTRKRYYLPDWKIDAEKLSSLLNGVGRMDLYGLAVGAAMGDPESIREAEHVESEFDSQLIAAVLDLDKKGLTQMENIQWFDSSSSGHTGVVCSVAINCFGRADKPVIGINCSDPVAKISSRGTPGLIARGLDLSSVMREACQAFGGNGGGHNIASGGSLPADKKDEFLKMVDELVGKQIGAK